MRRCLPGQLRCSACGKWVSEWKELKRPRRLWGSAHCLPCYDTETKRRDNLHAMVHNINGDL